MVKFDINIWTYDKKLSGNFIPKNSTQFYSPYELKKGIKLQYIPQIKAAAIDPRIIEPNHILLIVDIAKDIGIAFFSMWLYDKLKNKKIEKITINSKEIKIKKKDIEIQIKEIIALKKKIT